jgi:cytochrome c-type biogenesis protein CcmH
MMGGWFAIVMLTALVFAALLFFSPERRKVWSAIAATLMLALAGYAIQGRPSLESAPAQSQKKDDAAFEALIAMRADMDQQFSGSKQWLVMSDSFARDGNFSMSAAFLQSAIKKNPRNGDLWAGLGLVLMLSGDGNMSPAANFAFAKTRALSPNHPAPDYYEGLATLFNGDPVKTLKLWESLVERGPKTAKWRPKLESQLAGLKTLLSSRQNASGNAGQDVEKK